MGTTLTPGAQAVYLSGLPTGSLVTPYEVAELRREAVAELGLDGLRVAQTVAALRNAASMPEGHAERFRWAREAARLADPDGLL